MQGEDNNPETIFWAYQFEIITTAFAAALSQYGSEIGLEFVMVRYHESDVERWSQKGNTLTIHDLIWQVSKDEYQIGVRK